MSNKTIKSSLVLVFFCLIYIISSNYFSKVYSADLDDVSATISNPRPSFSGALDGNHSSGASIVNIHTTSGDYPSVLTDSLVEGDGIAIGTGASIETNLEVATTSSATQFYLKAGLASAENDGYVVISTKSSDITVKLKTVSAVPNGSFRILVPALSHDTNSADGLPDGGYFDFGTSTGTLATLTCPSGSYTNYTFGASTATASNVTLAGVDYHSFICPYTGSGEVAEDFSTSSDFFLINDLINPAPKSNHSVGTADTHKIIIQNLDGSSNVIDQTSASIGVIEAVKVTASVAPQITFQITGVTYNKDICGFNARFGNGTDVTTTPATVPFGELGIADFTTAAQVLSVTTNAVDGFVVTAIENDQLGRNGGTCTGDSTATNCIRDSAGDTTSMTHAVSDEWVTTSNKGFAYSLHDVTGVTTEAFAYNESSRTFSARQFADAEDSQSPQTLFSSTAPTDDDELYVCYQIIPDTNTAAGNYENYITYTATATF